MRFVFKLESIVEAKFLQGCSGAPIVDSKGNLVSIVIGGDGEEGDPTNIIYGVPLYKIKNCIDSIIQQEKNQS